MREKGTMPLTSPAWRTNGFASALLRRASSIPSTVISIQSAGVPASNSTSPGSSTTWSQRSAIHARSSSPRSAKIWMRRRSSAVTDALLVGLMARMARRAGRQLTTDDTDRSMDEHGCVPWRGELCTARGKSRVHPCPVRVIHVLLLLCAGPKQKVPPPQRAGELVDDHSDGAEYAALRRSVVAGGAYADEAVSGGADGRGARRAGAAGQSGRRAGARDPAR